MNWIGSAIGLVCAAGAILIGAPLMDAPAAAADPGFSRWIEAQWPHAQKLGVSRRTFTSATHGLEPDLRLPDLDRPGKPGVTREQAEFVQTPAAYIREATIARLAERGRKLAAEHRATLKRKLPHNAIRVLATQGYYGRRKDMFREEFLYALKILEEGHVKLADMRSSWGGAMGLTQFLPTEFYKHALDFDGDGRRDIWRSVPDALASAAQQLVNKGWQRGVHWAYEVRPPKTVDCTMGVPEISFPLRYWLERNYVPTHGRRPSEAELSQRASLLQPEGIYGPSFLTTKNYYVIKDYNFSDLYVLFVGHLSDRISDLRKFATPWSKQTQLRTNQVELMQRNLAKLGLYKDKIDGKAGMLTRAALGAYQKANHLKVDCWPTPAVLAHMQSRGAR
jgi:membrane-bound lytic murein transglycosylase B